MKRLLLIQISCFLLFLTVGSCTSAEKMTNDRRQDFTADWTFHLGDDSAASRPDYDDTAWRILNLPHDWAIEGEFSRDNPGHYPVVSVGIAKRLLLTKRMKASACFLILTVYI